MSRRISRRARVTKDALVAALSSCGLGRGDAALVHSDLVLIGPVEGGRDDFLPTYYHAFREVLGDTGTLVVPAFFYDYGRDQTPFDLRLSPVSRELGVFARYIAGRSGAHRSPNPIASLAAVGPRADFICGGGTGSAFGVDSPWDRLLQSDGQMVFVGIDLRAMTFIHYVEHMVGVPHVYNKHHRTRVFDNGRPVELPISSQVRYLDFGIEYDLEGLTARFEDAGLVTAASVGRGIIRCLRARTAFDFLKDRLKQDFSYLLKRPPDFVPGRIPADGPTGPPPSQ